MRVMSEGRRLSVRWGRDEQLLKECNGNWKLL
jgi:hypothetical protein